MAVVVWREARDIGQPFKALISIGVVGVLLFSNITLLRNKGLSGNASAEVPFPSNEFVVYYPFDDNQYGIDNNSVQDWSGNGYDGVRYNHANYTGNTPFGRAMDFDGEDDYIQVGPSLSESLMGDITVELWIFYRGGSDGETFISAPNFYIYIYNGLLYFQSCSNYIHGTEQIELYKWVQIACTRSIYSNELYIYVNGQIYAHDIIQLDDTNRLGYTNIGWHYNGIIDELKIYNDVKTPAQGIGRRVLDMAFEENNGNIAHDRSGMNFKGAINGASWDTNGTYEGRCLNFDGINDVVEIEPSDTLNLLDFTIDAWICWAGSNQEENYNTIIAEYGHYWLYINNDGNLCYSTTQSYGLSIISGDSIPVGKWTKISVQHCYNTQNGNFNNVRIFINGTFENDGCDAYQNYYPYPAYTTIGGYCTGGSYFNGRIDNIQIYNSVNDVGCEVLRNQFETGNSSEAKDESPYQNDGVLMNGASKLTYHNYTYLRYGSALNLENSNGGLEHVYVPSQISSPAIGLDYLYYYTLEARINWSPKNEYNGVQFILYHWGDFQLYLDGNDTEKTLGFINGDSLYSQAILSSTHGIPADTWTYVAVTVSWSPSSEWMTGKIFINGVLDVIGLVNKSSTYTYNTPMYIGGRWPYEGENPADLFNGYIDDIVISKYPKTFHEDTDSDGMTDEYEIVRSVDSREYNYLEYNGRYAILCAPVRVDYDNQFKYDITQMRYYLVANGWSDCDIIFLTCKDNNGRDGSPPPLSNDTAKLFNGDWIDGEAYYNNLGAAFEALKTGGSFELEQSDETYNTFSIAQVSVRDILLIEFRDHGDGYNGSHYFCTYSAQDYDIPHNDTANHIGIYWSAGDVDAELDEISTKYTILEIDMCLAGGWCGDQNGRICDNNRFILMSQDDQESYHYAYIFYARVFGKILGSFLDNNGGLPLHSENIFEYPYSTTGASNQDANADGIIDINVTWDTQYGCDDKEPIRADECYWNGIISLKEAHYMAECACNDRFYRILNGTQDIEQNPQIWISDMISISAPSLYL